MRKQKFEEYLLRSNVKVVMKSGETYSGKIRKIGSIYVIGTDTQLVPINVKKIIVPKTETFKFLERKQIERNITWEKIQFKKTKNVAEHYVVRYNRTMNGHNKVIVDRKFKTLVEAKEFKTICEKNFNEMKFASRVVEDLSKKYSDDYPEDLLKQLGIVPETYDNFYNEIVPNFEKNFAILCHDTLTDREEDVIKKYFADKLALQEIADIYKITRERVRQILVKAVKKLSHSRGKKILIGGNHEYELINAQERQELYEKLKKEMNYDLAMKYIEEHNKKIIVRTELDETIEELDLSVRSYNCLRRANINTVGDLLKMPFDGIFKVRNLGKKSLKEIRERLAERGHEIGELADE